MLSKKLGIFVLLKANHTELLEFKWRIYLQVFARTRSWRANLP